MAGYEDETHARAAYEEWRESDRKDGLKTFLLRLAWRQDQPVEAGKDRAHWMDVELVAKAIMQMPGRKPSWEYLQNVAEVLRSDDNHRPLTHERNVAERRVAQMVASSDDDDKTVSGHDLVKVRKQAEFLEHHKKELPKPLVKELSRMLAKVKDEDGRSVMDQRRLKGAGSHVRPDTAKSPSTRQKAKGHAAVAKLELSPSRKEALNGMVETGSLRFNKDTTVDETSAAVRSGQVAVRDNGQVDGRSISAPAAKPNAWNEFQQKHKDQNLTKAEMKQSYWQDKEERSPKPKSSASSASSSSCPASARPHQAASSVSFSSFATSSVSSSAPAPSASSSSSSSNSWNVFQSQHAGQGWSRGEMRDQYYASKK